MARGFKTGGRQKGSRNKATLDAEKVMARLLAERAAEAVDGSIDSYDFLTRLLRAKELPLMVRVDIAKTLLKHERPVLAATAVGVAIHKAEREYTDQELRDFIAAQ